VKEESDYIQTEKRFDGDLDREETFCDILFTDGSWLRVLDLYAGKSRETKLIEAFPI
jgi:hypothetical protein